MTVSVVGQFVPAPLQFAEVLKVKLLAQSIVSSCQSCRNVERSLAAGRFDDRSAREQRGSREIVKGECNDWSKVAEADRPPMKAG